MDDTPLEEATGCSAYSLSLPIMEFAKLPRAILGKQAWLHSIGTPQRGDDSALRKFRGVRIRAASGESIPLLTEPEELNRLGNAGVLSFESLYARSA